MAKSDKKGGNKLDTKSALIYIGIFALLLIAGIIIIISMNKGGEVKEVVNTPQVVVVGNSSKVDLSADLAFLTECLKVNGITLASRPDELKNCSNVREEEIKKLSIINGTEGKVICDSFGKEDNGQSYRNCFGIIERCEAVFVYVKASPLDTDKEFYYLYECKDNVYFSYSHQTPLENRITKLDMAREDLRMIKYGY